MAIRKKFSKSLFTQNDSPAREAVMNFLSQEGFLVKENPDKYGADLIVHKGFKPGFYIEAEVKRVWRKEQDTFPWDTIQLPERKSKFTKLDMPCEFWILREDLKRAIRIPDFVVRNSPLVPVKNVLVQEGELFFRIDIEQCDLVELS